MSLKEKYLGKVVTFNNPDTGEPDKGKVIGIEKDGTLEVETETNKEETYLVSPKEAELQNEGTPETESGDTGKAETDDVKEEDGKMVTAESVRKIQDKAELKGIIKANQLKPTLNVYRSAESMQTFIIQALGLDEEKKHEEKVTAKVPQKETKTEKPGKAPKAPKTPKVKKERELSVSAFICDLISKGTTDRDTLIEKSIKRFPDHSEKDVKMTVVNRLRYAHEFHII